MTRRRANPLSIFSSSGAESQETNGTMDASSASSKRSIRFVIGVITFCILYYTINWSERRTIQRQVPILHASSISVKQNKLAPPPKQQDEVPPSDISNELQQVRTQPTYDFVLSPAEEFRPQICWLMSFPNSGTSYTMTMVARSSNKAFATNYADEVTALDDLESLSIYPRRPEGPYWAGLSGKIASPRPLPETYVMTKTHCGSRCVECGPEDYVESPEVFLRKCASGHARALPKRRKIDVEYPPNRIGKAIHLIRNPFHNLIARYHLEHRHHVRSNQTEWAKKHPNTKEGLQLWCQDLDTTYAKQDKTYFKSNYETLVKNVPCHGEFFKYTQWHNLVHEGLALVDHDVPVLTVYYEHYTRQFNQTVKSILDFLELEHVGILREFEARSDYDGYFTSEQQAIVKTFVQSIASNKTWSQIRHYF